MFHRSSTPERHRPRLMLPDERRARFEALAAGHDVSLAELSRILGRHDGYISSYLSRAAPYDLPEAERRKLAQYFGVDGDTLKPRRYDPSLRGRVRRPTFPARDRA